MASTTKSFRIGPSEDKNTRRVFVNTFPEARQENMSANYPSNMVLTTKYNMLNIIPKNIYEQFHRTANVYFLFVGILMFLPTSPKEPFSLMFAFSLVLLVTFIKDATEDYRRYRSDQEINLRMAKVYDPPTDTYNPTHWSNIKVGDLVRVDENCSIPADILLVATSSPIGISYFDTSNLDGETNLKRKETVNLKLDTIMSTPTIEKSLSLPIDTRVHRLGTSGGGSIMLPPVCYTDCAVPSDNIYQFDAKCGIAANLGSETRYIPCSLSQTAWRGFVLRNTSWVVGLVLYTGSDTKIMLNSTGTRHKASKVQRTLNKLILGLFSLYGTLVVISAITSTSWMEKHDTADDYLYLPRAKETFVQFIENVLTFCCTYSMIVPISLYVALEIVKTIQGLFLQADIKMYDEKTDTPCRTITFGVLEDLGQIDFLFTDKTGTLTENVMEFAKCSCGGVSYDGAYENSKECSPYAPANFRFKNPLMYKKIQEILKKADHKNKPIDLDSISNIDPETAKIIDFWLTIVICNSIVVDQLNNGVLKYAGPSPDEKALVEAASYLGMKLIYRSDEEITLNLWGNTIKYSILHNIDFTPERKMMSVIVRTPGDKIRLFCKGADTVIFPKMSKETSDIEETKKHLLSYAQEGLRTLCVASAYIDQNLYDKWRPMMRECELLVHQRKEKEAEAAAFIEKDLTIHGITAIEDRLQEGVPETIRLLSAAGIKIWMLTGDMQETAINIGHSCKLVRPEMKIINIDANSIAECKILISDIINLYQLDLRYPTQTREKIKDVPPLCCVINGKTLGYALTNENQDGFSLLARFTEVFLCCRAAPLQKSEVVSLINRKLNAMTLAIGDGANDCSMIQTADVGVGISGHEGMQAARSADFAFSQFRFLQRLVLVHGRWNYNRLTALICYYFYKNIAVSLSEFFFNTVSGFSGQLWFADYLSMGYNALWTSISVTANGFMDQDVSTQSMNKYPQLYRSGPKGTRFNGIVFTWWVFTAVLHAALCFYLPVYTLRDANHIDGQNMGNWLASFQGFFCLFLTVTYRLALHTQSWTWVNHVAVWLVQLAFFLVTMFIICVPPLAHFYGNNKLYDIVFRLIETPSCWILTITVPIICIIPNIVQMYIVRWYYPQSFQIIQEIEIEEKTKKNDEKKSLLQS